ncbi:MAG TPA: ABC transporter ATP-binding protein [Phycisphaerae bacterium]|nr:ABC transporter ATP-binding protein [Phycisphaerae bacterium]
MAAILEVTDLRKDYVLGAEVVHALDGLSLSIDAGQFVAVMGASGSGKSTLLHLLGGLDVPTGGRIVIEGHDLAAMSDRQRTLFRRRRLGIIFQAFNLLPSLNAAENVALPLMVDRHPWSVIEEKTASLLDVVDLAGRRAHRPQALSGGEQQRVAIARALVNDPAIVLADEPTGNLDSHHTQEIWELLGRLAHEQDRTVVAVTHEATGAAHADRIVVLKDGRSVGEIEPTAEADATLVATRYSELVG